MEMKRVSGSLQAGQSTLHFPEMESLLLDSSCSWQCLHFSSPGGFNECFPLFWNRLPCNNSMIPGGHQVDHSLLRESLSPPHFDSIVKVCPQPVPRALSLAWLEPPGPQYKAYRDLGIRNASPDTSSTSLVN